MDGILKKVVMSAACAASILVGGNKLHAYASNLAQSQDVQRQVGLAHGSVLSNAYEIDENKDSETKEMPAKTIGFARLLGYFSSFDKGEVSKDKTSNGGFLLGLEKAFSENWTFGAFTGFQYADCKFKANYDVSMWPSDGNQPPTSISSLYTEHADSKCQTKSIINGLYGRYEGERLLLQVAGSAGFHHYKHDGDIAGSYPEYGAYKAETSELDADYYGWSLGLSGRAAYNFSNAKSIKFGPLLGLDCSYISNDSHCETEIYSQEVTGGEAPEHYCYKMNKHVVKSLKTFAGLFASMQFSKISHPTMAYAEAGWSYECLRSGNNPSWETDWCSPRSSSSIGPVHPMHDESMRLWYLPRSTVDGKIGIKTKLSDSWCGGIGIGLTWGSHYRNIFGELSVETAF